MTLIFEDESGQEKAGEYKALAEKVIEEALEQEGCPYEVTVSLTLTDPASIQEMNRDWRGIDSSTDVLSFPLLSFEREGDFSFLDQLDDNELADWFEPDTGELQLGDIVINMEQAAAQAALYGHSMQREFAFLTAHSMFHLMGYDHLEETQAARMEAKQEAVLSALGIGR